jgi:hypothetical protein
MEWRKLDFSNFRMFLIYNFFGHNDSIHQIILSGLVECSDVSTRDAIGLKLGFLLYEITTKL